MIIGVVVDMQNDFVEGALGTPEAQAVVPYIQNEIRNPKYDMILFTQDWHNRVPERNTIEMKNIPCHCLAGTKGAEIVKGLIPEHGPSWTVYKKHTFAYYSLADAIMDESCGFGDDVTEIHLMGVCTDICVISNALLLRSAFPSMPIYVHSNGCAGTTPAAHEAALMIMRNCLINVI